MQCSECQREFFPDRDDAITCSNRCRQARFRLRHRKLPTEDASARLHEIRSKITALEQLYARLGGS